jgi:hypothetical protein
MTQEEIRVEIARISELMKGPLPDLDRALLNEERRELRQLLDHSKLLTD